MKSPLGDSKLFIKKTPKTPSQDLAIANERLKKYENEDE